MAAAMAMHFMHPYVSTRAPRGVAGASDTKEKLMIVSVLVRRLEEVHTFEEFITGLFQERELGAEHA